MTSEPLAIASGLETLRRLGPVGVQAVEDAARAGPGRDSRTPFVSRRDSQGQRSRLNGLLRHPDREWMPPAAIEEEP